MLPPSLAHSEIIYCRNKGFLDKYHKGYDTDNESCYKHISEEEENTDENKGTGFIRGLKKHIQR